MPFDDILDKAKNVLTARKTGIPLDHVEAFRKSGSLPASVLFCRAIGVDDDTATAAVLADHVELDSLRKRVHPGISGLLAHPPHLIEAWAVCEVLRSLGFDMAADVYVGWGSVKGQGDDVVYVVLQSGGLDMKICTSRFAADSKEEALAGWGSLIESLMSAGDDEIGILYSRSRMGNALHVVALAAELVRLGFKIRGAGPLATLAGPLLSSGGEG